MLRNGASGPISSRPSAAFRPDCYWEGTEIGPPAPETFPEGGGLRTPPFGIIVGASGAVQTPNICDFLVLGVGFHDYINTKLGLHSALGT